MQLTHILSRWFNQTLFAMKPILFTLVATVCYAICNISGDVVTITSITVLVPVVASLIKFGITNKLPKLWQVSGYFLAACAVVLVAKGGTTK